MRTTEMRVAPEVVDQARSMLESGSSVDSVLRFAVDAGLGKPYCILLLKKASTLPSGEIKDLVDASPVFAYRRETDERFQGDVIDTLKHHFGAVEDEHGVASLRRELLPKAS